MSPLFMVVFILGSASIAEATLKKPAATAGSETYNSITLTITWPDDENVETVEYEISDKNNGDVFKKIPLADKDDFTTYVVDGLTPDTDYTFVIKAKDTALTSPKTEAPSDDITSKTLALPDPDIKYVSADEKSISLEWDNYEVYTEGKTFKAAGKDISTDSKDILIDNLTPATVVSTEAKGTYKGITSTANNDYCTAPSKPAVSYSKTETSTLLLVVDFTGGSKVTHLEIVTSEAITKLPTIEASQGTIANTQGMKTFTATLETTLDAGQKFEVTFEDFPESASITEVSASYKDGQCEDPGTVKVTVNRANLASKEATFVYLVICLMATVLRSFGIEVWSPIGSH